MILKLSIRLTNNEVLQKKRSSIESSLIETVGYINSTRKRFLEVPCNLFSESFRDKQVFAACSIFIETIP